MNAFLCDLKIIPEKEKKTAQINVFLYEENWFDLNILYKDIISVIKKEDILQYSILEQNTCFIEINYEALETTSKKIEEFIKSAHELKLMKKQIFIKKLGGWFDF